MPAIRISESQDSYQIENIKGMILKMVWERFDYDEIIHSTTDDMIFLLNKRGTVLVANWLIDHKFHFSIEDYIDMDMHGYEPT